MTVSPPSTSDLDNSEQRVQEVRRDQNTSVIEGEEFDEDEVNYPDDSEELDVTHLKVKSLEKLGMKRLKNLKSACFRQNLIKSLRGLEDLPPNLEILDLYDNRLAHMGGGHFDHFTANLTSLDLSFNTIKHIKGISHLTGLRNLYLCQNNITSIEGLENLTSLVNLELGANKIREICNIDKLVNLEQLWLGKNKITELKNLQTLKKLKILSIQSNRITKIEGLESLESLEELYISFNGIEVVEGLEHNHNLQTIDISNNRIEKLSGLSHLSNLEELWASGNKLADFMNVEAELKNLPKLNTVYFEQNPLQQENRVTYRNKVKLSLGPTLKQIDAAPIR